MQDCSTFDKIPAWLEEQKEIIALLHRVLDKLDAIPVDQRTNAPGFTINKKSFPRLFILDQAADQQWELFKSLIEEYKLFELRLNKKRDAFDPVFFHARLHFNVNKELLLRCWLQRPRAKSQLQAWQDQVDELADHFPGNVERLRLRSQHIDGRDDQQVLQQFVAIGEHVHDNMTLRQLSARCFWGISKFLDNKQELLCDLYPDLEIMPRHLVINVYLPENFDNILFIENQDSYNQAIAVRQDRNKMNDALVYSSGFKGSALRIRTEGNISLHYHSSSQAQSRESFEKWWFKQNDEFIATLFFGDLDFSGMAIYAALKKPFEDIKPWVPGYEVLLEQLNSGLGHTPKQADKQLQIDPQIVHNEYIDQVLLPAIRHNNRFMDQEFYIFS